VNLDQIVADARAVVPDSAGNFVTTTELVTWANQAQLDLAARLSLLQETWTGTVTSGAFTLPYTLIEITRLRITGDDTDVQFTDDEIFTSYEDAGSTSLEPRLGRVWDEQVELYPEPADATAYTLRGIRKPARLVSGETAATKTVSAATASAEVATFTTSTAHGYSIGDWIDVAGVTPAGYNGAWQVASVPLTTTFTAHIGTSPSALSVAGTAEKTDVPEIAEELHYKIVAYARWQALLKFDETRQAEFYMAQYLEGLPSAPTARARTMPGPLALIPQTSPFQEGDSGWRA